MLQYPRRWQLPGNLISERIHLPYMVEKTVPQKRVDLLVQVGMANLAGRWIMFVLVAE